MIYIGTEVEEGGGVYVDVHAVTRRRKGLELHAVIGDGRYEGELLVEIGSAVEITFVDALWGDAKGLRVFLDRHGEGRIRDELRTTLCADSAAHVRSCSCRGVRPHVYLPLLDAHGVVAEAGHA